MASDGSNNDRPRYDAIKAYLTFVHHHLTTASILDLFDATRQAGRPLLISAPMVRYSKLTFRLLAAAYGTDVTYTPMMLAHEFNRSAAARDSDFSTCPREQRSAETHSSSPTAAPLLIAQFAASEPEEFARAASLIAPWVDGIDLNCGCPQSWAVREGIGCSLMERPELVAAMVAAARSRLAKSHPADMNRRRPSISVKIRIHPNLAITEQWLDVVQASEAVDYITIHGRTRSQRSSTPPDLEAIKRLARRCRVPVVANGDVYVLDEAVAMAARTGVDGVMAARGILENPAMFAGHTTVPIECVRRFVEDAVRSPIPFALVLHHMSEMTARMPGMTKRDKKRLMACADMVDLIDYVEEQWPLSSHKVINDDTRN